MGHPGPVGQSPSQECPTFLGRQEAGERRTTVGGTLGGGGVAAKNFKQRPVSFAAELRALNALTGCGPEKSKWRAVILDLICSPDCLFPRCDAPCLRNSQGPEERLSQAVAACFEI